MAKKIKKNVAWKRVVATPTPKAEVARQNKNKGILESEMFKNACEAAGVQPTRRQASKFNNSKGLAFKGKNNIF